MADSATAEDHAIRSAREARDPSTARAVDLAPDTIADAQQRDGKTRDLVTLCGFLGTSDAADHVRLFTDPAFQCWVDICEGDIRHRQHLPAEQDAFGGRSIVWANSEVRLVQGEVTTADAEAKFLTGPWSSETPWQLGHECLDGATLGPKGIYSDAPDAPSPRPTGIGCCH